MTECIKILGEYIAQANTNKIINAKSIAMTDNKYFSLTINQLPMIKLKLGNNQINGN